MATTTNFGWTTPNDTDLVKNGAAAIRTLGSAVDTSLAQLKGGTTGQVLSKTSNTDMAFTWVAQDDSNAIQNALLTTTGDTIYASSASTPARLGIGSSGQALTVVAGVPSWAASATSVLTTTGDLLYASAANTLARRAIGTTGQVLTVSGGVPTWATPASGGSMTLINTGGTTFSGASVSISSIPSTYKKLEIIIVNPRPATDGATGTVRFNGSSTANTYFNAEGSQTDGSPNAFNANAVNWSYTTDNGTQAGLVHIVIPDYANSTTWKFAEINSIVQDSTTSTSVVNLLAIGSRNNTEAISSLEFLWSSGNSTSGTIYVYGVN